MSGAKHAKTSARLRSLLDYPFMQAINDRRT